MIYKLSINDIKSVCWHPLLGAPSLTKDEKNIPFIEVRIIDDKIWDVISSIKGRNSFDYIVCNQFSHLYKPIKNEDWFSENDEIYDKVFRTGDIWHSYSSRIYWERKNKDVITFEIFDKNSNFSIKWELKYN